MRYKSGRHFLQLPGPTQVPERVLHAMARATIDHRGPDFARLTEEVMEGLGEVFRTEQPVFVYPSSATGAWEAALANVLSPGDRVLAFHQGYFAIKWAGVAKRFGLDVQLEPWEPRRGVAADAVVDTLRADTHGRIKAVMIVHNETSTGVTSDVQVIATAIQESNHPALLLADAVSSLAATALEHDRWAIDVTVTGSQKGLMLPPGLSFVAASARAQEARGSAGLPRAYWDWGDHLEFNRRNFFPYTPATNLLYGLRESLAMLREEGLDNVVARHARYAAATRVAVKTWGLDIVAFDPAEASNALTAVMLPEGHDADHLRSVILERFDMSLGTGLGNMKGKVFRIGHLGALNELTLLGALAGVEMGLKLVGPALKGRGTQAALDYLAAPAQGAT